jgi:threonyl-tRNA synthetase
MLGAIERFLGVLIEHYAGALPAWLMPEQARVLNISDGQAEYAQYCLQGLRAAGIRAEADLRNEKLGYKVREAQMEKIPYVLVVGEQEVAAGQANLRLRGGKNIGLLTIQEIIDRIWQDCQEPFKRGGMSYSFVYQSAP